MSDERVERIHREGVVVDGITNLLTEGVLGAIDDYRSGGVHLICQSIDPTWRHSALARPHLDLAPDPHTALRTIAWVRRLVQQREDLAFVTTASEARDAKAEGRLGVMLHSQNASPFGMDLDLVHELRGAGLRMSGLAYNVRSLAADGCKEESNAGLSRFGRRLVREMQAVGMIVDGSHAGERSTLEATELAEAPFVFSHSGCAAVHPHPRNVTDEQLRRCAGTGGLVGIVAIPPFLTDGPTATLDDVLAHLLHAVDVVGTEHVGLGLDFWYGMSRYTDLAWPEIDRRADDGVPDQARILWDPGDLGAGDDAAGQVEGLAHPGEVSNLTAALFDRGLDEVEVRAIVGGNWLRVLEATEA
ncbi:MAG TPA: membrane dipeptidase [Actinomycetota bacterium]|nr:membrane dipeptidase [Actinomycetota bacterium]